MPELTATEVRSLFDELRGANAARNGEYLTAIRRYRGEHWTETSVNSGSTRYQITANYMRPAIKGAVRDLFGRMPGVQVLPDGADDESRRKAEGSEGVIYRCWEDNQAAKCFRRAAHNQVLLRRGLLYVWWDPESKSVRFRSENPANFYALKDGEQIVECILVSRRLTSELRRQYGSEIRSDEDQSGVQQGVSGTATGQIARFTPPSTYDTFAGGVTDALLDDGSWNGPDVPGAYTTVLDYFHRDGTWMRIAGSAVLGSGKLAYGVEDVPFIEVENDFPGDEDEPEGEIPEDVFELNQYLNELLSQQANIIKKYSNPTILDKGSGVDPTKIRNIVQGDAGVLPIRKDGDLHFLNWDGPQPAINEQREAIKGILHDLTGRPAVSYGETVTNQSGVMTNLAMNPATAAATDRQVLWGMALVRLNEWILRLYEKFAPSRDLSYKGYVPSGQSLSRMRFLDTSMGGLDGGAFKGRDINHWYRNQIKWPSVLRTDDPMYVQNIISQVTSDPPLMSVYDAIEALGHDDAEGMADRIAAQLEDPRFHPDRLKGAIDAASAMAGIPDMGGMEGLMPMSPGGGGMPMSPDGGGTMGAAAQASGNPNRDLLAGG